MTATDAAPDRRRIIGIDLARFVAIVGMMAAHLLTGLASNPEALLIGRLMNTAVGLFVSSTAATTFAVLGGVSLVLLSGSMRGAAPWRVYVSIVIRGAVIALIGWGLMQLHSPISVVLSYYGVAMIIAGAALWLPSWAIAALAGVLWLGGGIVNAHIRLILTSTTPEPPSPDVFTLVVRSVRDLLLTGHYPAITWTAYMLVGMLLARLLLRARREGTLGRICLWLWTVGLGVYLAITIAGRAASVRPQWFGLPTDAGPLLFVSARGAPQGTELWMLLAPAPHSGSPTDMLRTVAGACFLIGSLVALFDARSPRIGFLVESVRAAGAAPLTIYSAHVVATTAIVYWGGQEAFAGRPFPPDAPLWSFLAQLAGVLAIGALLAALHRRAPLEAMLGWLSGSSRLKRRSDAGG